MAVMLFNRARGWVWVCLGVGAGVGDLLLSLWGLLERSLLL